MTPADVRVPERRTARERARAWLTWTGVVPLGLFVVVHMVTVSSALAGRARFEVTFTSSAVVRALTIALVLVPLAFHALYGTYESVRTATEPGSGDARRSAVLPAFAAPPRGARWSSSRGTSCRCRSVPRSSGSAPSRSSTSSRPSSRRRCSAFRCTRSPTCSVSPRPRFTSRHLCMSPGVRSAAVHSAPRTRRTRRRTGGGTRGAPALSAALCSCSVRTP